MVGYLIMVFLAPFYHKITKPLSLRMLMIVYNSLCSIASVGTCIAFGYGMYNVRSVFALDSSDVLKHAFLIYWIMKNIELLDTVFMILRHKHRQISFLHVYHHSSMVLLSNFAYQYSPYAGIAFLLSLNSFVHIWLYYYYSITAYDSSQSPSWKKRITQLQIAQFVIAIVHTTLGYQAHGFCVYSMFYSWSMMVLFSNFYYQAFIRKRKPKSI
ncbi:elongation of very long chain fatty acids protein 4-like [Anneissia japonica]|uniref:elongation of very long chain fatty acids protein 4-like n=1 Tax=Anneissia japonica TaxID=1529436 RepID=UPI001425B155|nr:elongation of very long chain fatty acids protein 4-like [Anneissia japonica]